MDQTFIQRIIEAALLASSQPLTLVQLHGLFPLDEPAPEGSIAQAIEALQADSAQRGVELVELASGWRFQVRADVHAWVARLWTERQTRYTRATLETLALIAYRQPITRGEIEQVRGVATNSNIIKALEEREWIRVVGHRDVPGRPELLGTTRGFLDYFGLKRLDELPPLSELKDFGELDPQFKFDGKADDAAMTIGNVAIGDVALDAAAGTPPADDGDGDILTDPADADRTTHTETVETAAVDESSDEDHADGMTAVGDRPSTHTPAHDIDDTDVIPTTTETSSDASNDPALADDGDSTRSTQ